MAELQAVTVLRYPDLEPPSAFTRAELGWVPWPEPVPVEELTDEQYEGLVERGRANSPYFRLLARDPGILGARTRTDNDIFYNPNAGLPRGERELAAVAASRANGCLFCASVHARFAAHYTKRPDDVQRLLDDGVTADQDERWSAIVAASVALTRTPVAFGPEHVAALRAAGLDDLAIADVIAGAAFFNWANRLMLSIGEPTPPAAG
jgi:alkylhydroperoxidase domain protein